MEGAILELNERRLVISWPSRTNARGERVNAHTAHSQRTWFKKCGECVGECLGEVAVCLLILFIAFIDSKKFEI